MNDRENETKMETKAAAEWQDGAKDLEQIERVVREHENRIRTHYSGDVGVKLECILEHYHDKAVRSMSAVEIFQQELLVNLRALALVANSVADGATHGEKNARIRGLIGILEGTYHQVSKWRFEMRSSLPPWGCSPVFQANYPAQHYLQRINDLEIALARATGESVKHSVFPQGDQDPFSE